MVREKGKRGKGGGEELEIAVFPLPVRREMVERVSLK